VDCKALCEREGMGGGGVPTIAARDCGLVHTVCPPPPLPPTYTPQVARNRISGIVGLDALTDLDALDVAGNVIADPQALGGLAACTRLGRIAASDNAMHRCPRYRFAMWVACDCRLWKG
jgi:hypothetical protein